jgi:hypothetical protein
VTRLRSLEWRNTPPTCCFAICGCARTSRSRKERAKLRIDTRSALLLGGFVYRQRRHGNGRKLICADVTRCKDLPRDGDRCHRISPAGVERQVRNDLRDLARLDTVVEREVEMIWHLDSLIARDQGSQGHNAAVVRPEAGALPYVAEEKVFCIGLQRRGDLPNVLIR